MQPVPQQRNAEPTSVAAQPKPNASSEEAKQPPSAAPSSASAAADIGQLTPVVSDGLRTRMISVMGLFGRPVVQFNQYRSVVLFAGGVGITPMASICAGLAAVPRPMQG